MSSPTDQAGGQPAVLREPAASELHVEDQGRDHQRGGAAADIVEQVLVGDMADPALDEALAQVMGTLLDAVIAAVPAAVAADKLRAPQLPRECRGRMKAAAASKEKGEKLAPLQQAAGYTSLVSFFSKNTITIRQTPTRLI